MQADLPIRRIKDALHGVSVGDVLTPLQAHHRRVSAADQLAHAGKAEIFACSPIFELHARFVRQTHIGVNAAVAGHVHR